MNEEKQIKDMAGIIFESNTIHSVWYSDAVRFAEALYHANCRRVTECKDCVHYRPYPKPVEDFDGMCTAGRGETDEDEFCSRGAKMEGEDDEQRKAD